MGDEPPRLPLQGRPLLGDPGPDAVDIEADVHAIGHRLLVGVFLHEVVVEEADGLGGRRGGQPDQEGVEVVQHLPPEVVDGAVALIDDDEIEGLDGDARVVDDRQRLLDQAGRQLEQRLLVGRLVELFLALEHRVQALDRRDHDLARRGDGVRVEQLDVVFVGELVGVHGADELLELR